jgi:hypothetical protein
VIEIDDPSPGQAPPGTARIEPLCEAAVVRIAWVTAIPATRFKSYTTLSAAHSNSPSPAHDRLSRRLFQTEQLRTLVDGRNPWRARRSLPRRQDVVSRIDGRHLGKAMIRRNPPQRSEQTSSSRKTGLQTAAASTPEHSHRTTLACVPTAGACCPVWPTPLGTAGSTAVGPDRRKTPTVPHEPGLSTAYGNSPAISSRASARQRPPRDVGSHDQSCARSDSLGFAAY